MFYFVRTPWWMKKVYPSRVWEMGRVEKKIYLTFDDGPHPGATPYVLDELKKYNAHATFFCIGKNVMNHPGIYERILKEGHSTGNHTQDHLNGWKTSTAEYSANISKASELIRSNLFRPPYGRIRSGQAKKLANAMNNDKARLVMWTVLSGDFDLGITKENCLQNVISKARDGSIVVFHDSLKAIPRLKYALPIVLKHFHENGYDFSSIPVT